MKTGLRLNRKLRMLYAYYNLLRFMFRKKLLGFDTANQFIQKVDKKSIQLILRKNGAIIGKNCDIESGLTFHNNKNYSNLIIGNNCHIGKNCFFDLRDKVIIKNNCVISMQVTFITHMEMNKSELSNLYPSSRGSILIENDVYIGTNAIILMNRTIGENSFIAAGSLINRDVDRGKMVGGVPAKVIKQLKKE